MTILRQSDPNFERTVTLIVVRCCVSDGVWKRVLRILGECVDYTLIMIVDNCLWAMHWNTSSSFSRSVAVLFATISMFSATLSYWRFCFVRRRMIRLNKWLFYSDLLGEIKSGIVSFCGFERCLKFFWIFWRFWRLWRFLRVFHSVLTSFNFFEGFSEQVYRKISAFF